MKWFRDNCEILKEAEYYTPDGGGLQNLKTTLVDGNFTLEFIFETIPHDYQAPE